MQPEEKTPQGAGPLAPPPPETTSPPAPEEAVAPAPESPAPPAAGTDTPAEAPAPAAPPVEAAEAPAGEAPPAEAAEAPAGEAAPAEAAEVPPEKKKILPRKCWLTVLLLVAAGITFTAFALALSGQGEISWGGSPLLFALNALPVLLVLALLWLATGQAWISCLVTGTLAFLVAGGNYFKVMFRDDPLRWEDLSLIREATQMSDQYQVELTPLMIAWIVVIVAFVLALFFLGRGKPRLRWRLAALVGTAAVSVAVFLLVCADDALYGLLAGDHAGDQRQAYAATGNLYPFVHSAGSYLSRITAYDEGEAEEILGQFQDETIPEEKKVSLISIQMEAMADLSVYDIDGLSPSVYADFHALQAESYSGTLITDIFAGGTTETEWAVLTGGNQHGDFSTKTDSVAWYLKSQGYTANGAHPCREWFYDRKTVNPNLGLDDYLFTDNYYYQFIAPGEDVAYDDVFFPDLEERLTEYFQTSNKPLFSFNVTYQGHGPYEDEVAYWGTDFCTGDYEEGTRNILNNYFYVVQNSAGHMREFTEFLDTLDEPVVLLLYGDHKPWMGNHGSIYEGLGISLDTATEEGFRNYYSTWYMIWGNQAAKDLLGQDFQGQGPDLSPCFLMNEVFELIGWQGSDYMQAQRQIAHALPVLHTTGWAEEKGVLTPTPSQEARQMMQTFQNLSTYDRTHAP